MGPWPCTHWEASKAENSFEIKNQAEAVTHCPAADEEGLLGPSRTHSPGLQTGVAPLGFQGKKPLTGPGCDRHQSQ